MSSASPIKNVDAYQGWLLTSPDALHVVMFYADWDAPSQPGGAMDAVLAKLAEVHAGVQFAKARA